MKAITKWLWQTNKDPVRPLIVKSNIENVCFKGGGMKGNAFVGVARALTELNIAQQIKRFIGSSAGAIFAGAAACRIPCEKLAEDINNTDFSKFKDSPWGIAGEGVRIIEYLGFYEGAYFYNWYSDLLEKHIGDKEITLQGIYDRFGSELVITTTNLTKKKLVFLNRHDNPGLQLRDAVRKSMAIPVFFIPVTEIDSDGIVHIFVDGGCTDNFPLDYFDDLYSSPEEAFGKTIGFDLENANQPLDGSGYPDQTVQINNIIDLITTLLNTTIEVIERVRLSPIDKYREIIINTWDYKSTDFNMKKEDIQKLSDSGYEATMAFFTDLEK